VSSRLQQVYADLSSVGSACRVPSDADDADVSCRLSHAAATLTSLAETCKSTATDTDHRKTQTLKEVGRCVAHALQSTRYALDMVAHHHINTQCAPVLPTGRPHTLRFIIDGGRVLTQVFSVHGPCNVTRRQHVRRKTSSPSSESVRILQMVIVPSPVHSARIHHATHKSVGSKTKPDCLQAVSLYPHASFRLADDEDGFITDAHILQHDGSIMRLTGPPPPGCRILPLTAFSSHQAGPISLGYTLELGAKLLRAMFSVQGMSTHFDSALSIRGTLTNGTFYNVGLCISCTPVSSNETYPIEIDVCDQLNETLDVSLPLCSPLLLKSVRPATARHPICLSGLLGDRIGFTCESHAGVYFESCFITRAGVAEHLQVVIPTNSRRIYIHNAYVHEIRGTVCSASHTTVE
jgi:hypothetical protein